MSYTPSPGYSPYAPPQQPYGNYNHQQFSYLPLSWKTNGAAIAIIVTVLSQIVLDGVQAAIGKDIQHNVGAALAIGGIGLLSSAASLAAAVIFFMWIHQAAKNIRAFGQGALEFSPGWCIGWWFIPFMSLVKPYQAMKEIWRASDPEAVKNGSTGWMTATTAGILPLWWATYLLGGIVGGVTAFTTMTIGPNGAVVADPTAGLPGKMIGHLLSGIAAVAVAMILRQIARRQENSWTLLTTQQAAPNANAPTAVYPGPAYGPQY